MLAVFRAFLLLLPPSLRRTYGEDMVEMLEARLERAGGRAERGRILGRALIDLLKTAVQDRVSEPHLRRRTRWADPEYRRATNMSYRVESWLQDVRYGFRSMRRAPGVTALLVLTIAAGIGPNVAIFSVVEGALLRELPVTDAESLVNVWYGPGDEVGLSSKAAFEALANESSVVDRVAYSMRSNPVLSGIGEPAHISSFFVSRDFFATLGVSPSRGRLLVSDDHVKGAEMVAVASWSFWKTQLGGADSAIGRAVVLNGRPVRIIGVGPRDLEYPLNPYAFNRSTALWLPIQGPMIPVSYGNPMAGPYELLARLKPGVTLEQARARFQQLADNVIAAAPPQPARPYGPDGGPPAMHVLAAQDVYRMGGHPPRDGAASMGMQMLIMTAAASLVLLIACANAANLLLARGVARASELATRGALGATGSRVVRQLLVESLLIALCGGLLGVLLAVALLPPLLSIAASHIPRTGDISINATVLLFALGASLMTGVVFGVIPAVQSTRRSRLATQPSHVNVTWRSRTADSFLVTQVALACVLTVGAGLLVKSFHNAVGTAAGGMQTDQIATFRLSAQTSDPALLATLGERLAREARMVPGVTAASVSIGIPYDANYIGRLELPEDRPGEREDETAITFPVTPDYLDVYGIRVVRGVPLPRSGRTDVALISEAAARKLFGSESPLGRRIVTHTMYGMDGPEQKVAEVIGVVSNLQGLMANDGGQYDTYDANHIYIPFTAGAIRNLYSLSVRTRGDAAAVVPQIRQLIHTVAPDMPINGAGTMTAHVAGKFGDMGLYMKLLLSFAVLAILIASMGVYAVMTYLVSRRRREIALRMALGAGSRGVLSLVMVRVLALSAVGLVIGLAAATSSNRLLQTYLFHVDLLDWWAFAGTALLLLVVSMVAGAVPTMRSLRVQPGTILRSE